MANFSEHPFDAAPKPQQGHEIGQNLDALSVHELEERVEVLKAEIERLMQKKQSKIASKAAADHFFK